LKIALAADHAGYHLKEAIQVLVKELGHEALDLGTKDPTKPSDYPDVADAVASAVRDGRAERGIAFCGSGVGVCIACNKFPGIRAGVCHDTYSAHQGVEHDGMNVLCLGERIIGLELAKELVRAYLGAKFASDAERHVRRVTKLTAIETRFLKA
jgi:ribose 5-phosphate isomerase B